MDDFLKAALLLSASRAPFASWEKLKHYEPSSLWNDGEVFFDKLELRPSVRNSLGELLLQNCWPERELERVEEFGGRFITFDDHDYPPRLKDLPQPPIGLYVKGKASILLKSSVAVVGTRKCSLYAKNVAESLGRASARAGFPLISGGARGVDSAGHSGCIAEKGLTAAVLGTAIDKVYPSEHRDLFRRIAEKGVLVSEYPMGTGGEPWRFPERNRIIVGLAGRVVVVESPLDGGAMITARLAMDIGRELWCVPGRITDDVAKGTNLLLQDGANLLLSIGDFIEKISGHYGQLLINFGDETINTSPVLTTDEKIVLALLQRQGGRTSDELLAESGLDFTTLQTCLMTLTAERLAIPSGPGRYSAVP